ncbi:MAG: hypothetical protein ABJZ55_16525 [Fuerstiella sp.]
MSWFLKPILVVLIVAGPIATAEAGLGSLLSSGAKAAAAKVGSFFGRSSKVTGKTTSKATSKTAGKVTNKVSSGLTSKASSAAAKSATASASQTVLSRLGVSGVAVMSKLPAAQARRFVELSETLARSPHKTEWLSLISKHGAKCLDFLWKNKSGISVAAGSGAVLLAPDVFLGTVGNVAAAGVKAAGQYVVKPAIDNAGEHVAKPLIESTVSGVRDVVHSHAIWNVLLIVLFVFAAGKLYAIRRR